MLAQAESKSFDYYAHPTKRGTLLQLNGNNQKIENATFQTNTEDPEIGTELLEVKLLEINEDGEENLEVESVEVPDDKLPSKNKGNSLNV